MPMLPGLSLAGSLPMIVKVECCVSSCSAKAEGGIHQLFKRGWRSIKSSADHTLHRRWRTHIGWCPACSILFAVVAHGESDVAK